MYSLPRAFYGISAVLILHTNGTPLCHYYSDKHESDSMKHDVVVNKVEKKVDNVGRERYICRL